GVLDGERNHRLLSGGSISDARNFDGLAGDQRIRVLRISDGSIGGNDMRAQDGGIEGYLALGNMAGGAFVVIHLEPAGVISASGEINIVVASAAGSASRLL